MSCGSREHDIGTDSLRESTDAASQYADNQCISADLSYTPIPTRRKFAQAILAEQLVDTSVIERQVEAFRDQLVTRKYLQIYLRDFVTDEDIKRRYQQHIGEFERREIFAQLLHWPLNGDQPDYVWLGARNSAEHARDLLLRQFPVKTFMRKLDSNRAQISLSKPKLLSQWFSESDLDPIVWENLTLMRVGDIVGPVETDNGYYVAKILEEPRVSVESLEAVKEKVRYTLMEEAKSAEIKRLLN